MPKTTVRLEDGYHTTVNARNHTWHSDVPEAEDGQNLAPTPEELLMGALGSCMAMTAKMYANRKGWQIDRITVNLDFERFRGMDYAAYQGEAAFIHEVREAVILEGNLDESQRSRILEIITKCPVRRVLANPVFFVDIEDILTMDNEAG